ncbi:flagellar type III secretion system pore protein FliP [Myxococcota bacterium]|nr:flagellar type III secretion system pore protein FliP [Myxococcota bacterium]
MIRETVTPSLATRIVVLLTVMSLAPALLITLTCFTRLIVVFSFLRQAIGIQNTPPNQVLVGLALFLTWFIMSPVMTRVNEDALVPFQSGSIGEEEALGRAMTPVREFMFRHTRKADLELFLGLSSSTRPATRDEVPSATLIPAFIISELKTAFEIGFLIYIPFLVVDMIVATTLLAMGMMVLPPAMISLPFKLLLFVMVDGWNLTVGSLVRGFGP